MIFKSLKDRINCTIIIFTACFLTVVCLIAGFLVRKSWTDDFVGKVSNLFLQNSERINAQLKTYDMTLDLVMQNQKIEEALTGEAVNTDIVLFLQRMLKGMKSVKNALEQTQINCTTCLGVWKECTLNGKITAISPGPAT